MVAVVQLVERLVVVQEVAGSSPVSHPIRQLSCSLPHRRFKYFLELAVADNTLSGQGFCLKIAAGIDYPG